ncbi:MAG: hypothetical protein HQK96_06380 [Nitrospirae bacterium]|nr:hypothetical protein [Nitrospirota bacterium]
MMKNKEEGERTSQKNHEEEARHEREIRRESAKIQRDVYINNVPEFGHDKALKMAQDAANEYALEENAKAYIVRGNSSNTLMIKLAKAFKIDKHKEILNSRAKGSTLEKIGIDYGLTRERVRQIESKYLNSFDKYLKYNPDDFLNTICKQTGYVSFDHIKESYEDLSDIFVHCLKKTKAIKARWSDALNGFLIGDKFDYQQFEDSLKELPDTLNSSELEVLITSITNKFNLPDEAFNSLKNYVLSWYNSQAGIFLRKTIQNTNIYPIVIEKYYPDGIKLFDDFEMKRFRRYVSELFRDVILPNDDRAICVRIIDNTVLCGRGKYILPDRINIQPELLQKIHDYILMSDKEIILYSELFEQFRNDLLENTNITNKHFLHGVLKYNYTEEFLFRRDVLHRDKYSKLNIRTAIEEFIRGKERVVSKNELREEFRGITDIVLHMAISTNTNIIRWESGQYLHSSFLLINQADKERCMAIVEQNMLDTAVSAQKIFEVFCDKEVDFLSKNNIYSYLSMFGVLKFMIGDEFNFGRSIISKKGIEIPNKHQLLIDFISEYETFKISELFDYSDEMGIQIPNFEAFLDEISDEYLQIDRDSCAKKSLVNISSDTISRIENATIRYMHGKGYVVLKKIDDFINYPEIGLSWNVFLLKSIIKEYSTGLKVIDFGAKDWRKMSRIIVEADRGFDTYEDILHHELQTESEAIPFKDVNEITKHLKRQELIGKTLPEFLFEKGIIRTDENGNILIC